MSAAGACPQRTHVGTRADIDVPGGLHAVIKGLSAAQADLGLDVAILHQVVGADRYETVRVPSSGGGVRSPADGSPPSISVRPVREYHFAQTAALLPPSAARSPVLPVFHFHGPWSGESRAQGQSLPRVLAKFLVEWRTYRRFDAFTAHSAAFRQMLVRQFRIPEERVALIYPGVDTAFFRPRDRAAVREAFGLPGDAFVVGSLRRLVPRMGLDLLLRAAARHRDVYVVIAGDGPARPELDALAGDLGIGHRVRFLGRIDDAVVPDFYSALDCSVIPSRELEGFGLVALEAMACGTPVIASDAGGLPEALGSQAPRWVFPVGDIAGLATLIGRVADNPPARRDLLEEAAARSWRQCALEMEAWFAGLWT